MNPRALAIQILARVQDTEAFLNAVIDAQLRRHPPADPRDAALVTEICYGASRRQMALDFGIQAHSRKRLDRMETRVLAALRVGAYQLFYMRLPPHAAVGETIEAVKQLRLSRAAGFVNAVLRKLGALKSLPSPPESDPVAHLAVRESHPAWLVSRWIEQFGLEQAEAMLIADNQPAPLAIRANTTRIARDDLTEQLRQREIKANPARHSPAGILVRLAGRTEGLEGYAEGLWQVQDEAAQLVGLYAAVPDSSRILDACAAPGGKACHLAEHHLVVAADLNAHKLERLEVEARRLGISSRIQTLVHDATVPFPVALGKFDAVLVDAPCSGLGTLRRHPELRYRRTEADIDRLAVLQGEILHNCQTLVSGGGLLVYAVCSTDSAEGSRQAERFLDQHPQFKLEPPAPYNFALPLWKGYLRTLPGEERMDGFFAARFRRLND